MLVLGNKENIVNEGDEVVEQGVVIIGEVTTDKNIASQSVEVSDVIVANGEKIVNMVDEIAD